MSTLSSGNVTDVNLVLKERTHMCLCINMLILTHNLGNWLIACTGIKIHKLIQTIYTTCDKVAPVSGCICDVHVQYTERQQQPEYKLMQQLERKATKVHKEIYMPCTRSVKYSEFLVKSGTRRRNQLSDPSDPTRSVYKHHLPRHCVR